jgi:aryl-alcohol dehydrogenase
MNTLQPRPGDSFAIFGVGTVGLAALMAARLAGCEPIIAVDRHESRLAIARELGATHGLDAAHPHLVDEVRRLAGGRGARFSLEAAGFPESLRAAVDVLGPRGIACLTGSAREGVDVPIEMRFLRRGRTVKGCVQGESRVQTFLPELVERYRAGELPVERLVRHYAFEEINEAVTDLLAGRTIKAVLRIEGTA